MRAALVAILLLLPFFTFPASASGGLVVDAGASFVALGGAPVPLDASVAGGLAPYAFAWSLAGDASRFAPADARATTLDTTGLPPGAHALEVRVTDAHGDVAVDTLRFLVGSSTVLVDRDVAVSHGIPDEAATLSTDRTTVPFDLAEAMGRLDATLAWPEGHYDLDLVVRGPGGDSGAQGATRENPERATLDAPAKGRWRVEVRPIASGPTTARLIVVGHSAGALPTASIAHVEPVVRTEAMTLRASAAGGAAPFAFAWDLDGDGVFADAHGAEVSVTLPPGDHVARVKATDAAGFEAVAERAARVIDASELLRFRCHGGDGARAMEFDASGGTCWMHGGHHTYFVDAPRDFRGLKGEAFSVEQQFSPSVPMLPDAFHTPLHVETSLDGVSWREVGVGKYQFLPEPTDPSGDLTRQYVYFDIADPPGEWPFRFVRVHQPLSLAQGLSGYLDHTHLDVVAEPLAAVAPPALSGTLRLSCWNDIMEDFFETHPCWFGGIDRYDAPSFSHTYALPATVPVERLDVVAAALPWRTDDWYQGAPVTAAPSVKLRVLTSVDGVTWTLRAEAAGMFGAPTPIVAQLGGVEARFVQIMTEPHARFDQHAQFAPNHHPRGFIVDSAVDVTIG